jgi:hypothetical protein
MSRKRSSPINNATSVKGLARRSTPASTRLSDPDSHGLDNFRPVGVILDTFQGITVQLGISQHTTVLCDQGNPDVEHFGQMVDYVVQLCGGCFPGQVSSGYCAVATQLLFDLIFQIPAEGGMEYQVEDTQGDDDQKQVPKKQPDMEARLHRLIP